MRRNYFYYYYVVLGLLLTACSAPPESGTGAQKPKVDPEVLFTFLTLENLQDFQSPTSNWTIKGKVFANYLKKHDLQCEVGPGVLVNQPNDEAKSNLFSSFEHGDIELKLEFMMPKGSNSGVYLMGRYEIQLFDSWGKAEVAHSDCGGIYQRWDKEEKIGYEGHAPPANASLAPGLWQELHIQFRAPRFDENGQKIANARFEQVLLNDFLLHKNVELTGPTRAAAFDDEATQGPLMLQGDHGPVAFRNIRYLAPGPNTLKLSELRYKAYESPNEAMPDFDKVELLAEGITPLLDVESIRPKKDWYAIVFEGELKVAASGEYKFFTAYDDGASMFLDGQMVLKDDGEPGIGSSEGAIVLEGGKTYAFRYEFYEEKGGQFARLSYEGPGITRTKLAAPKPKKRNPLPVIQVAEVAEPMMQRSFFKHQGDKLTHSIAVGDPAKVHYNFDLLSGSISTLWRGGFGDLSQMWGRRGPEQTLSPLNGATEARLNPNTPFARIKEAKAKWPKSDSLSYAGYRIDATGRPIFMHNWENLQLKQSFKPISLFEGVACTAKIEGEHMESQLYYRLAIGKDIIWNSEAGVYRIDGAYYLKPSADQANQSVVVSQGDQQELRMPILRADREMELQYTLLW